MKHHRLTWLILAFLLVSITLGAPQKSAAQETTPTPYYVSASNGINVRLMASTDAPIYMTLQPGAVVSVVGETAGESISGNATWFIVSINGETGFVHSSLLRPRSPDMPPPATVEPSTSRQPANPNATVQAAAVLDYLYELPERRDKRVIAGQFGAYGDGTSRETAEKQLQKVFDQSGEWPALTGMDYARWMDDGDFTEPNGFLIDQWQQGALVNISWHAANPWTNGSSNDWQNVATSNPYDTRSVRELTTPGSAAYDRWITMLDTVASGLQELQDAGVIVLWRPLHEMNAGWAWWHRQNPDDFKALWRQMFDYLTHEKKLNNLLWVYSPNTNHSEWDASTTYYYPGPDYVDIVGLDKYMDVDEDPMQLNRFGEYDDLLETGKPIGLFEFGPLPASGEGWNRVKYNYDNLIRDIKTLYPRLVLFQAWEYVWQMGNHNNVDKLMSDPWVIVRGELPEWDEEVE